MGSDNSKLKGLNIDKTNPVSTTELFVLYDATLNDDTNLSIFIEKNRLFDKARKNLMVLRHPHILKYISSCNLGSEIFLATEHVVPLSKAVPQMSDIQICLGLRNILTALIFLVEQAKARHLNICIDSIYFSSKDGEWRLGGFEYVWQSSDLTKFITDTYMEYRYKSAVDVYDIKNTTENLEQYAFGVLCEEILKTSSDTPYIIEYREYCAAHLKNKNQQMRPTLSAILLHPYFNHEFILIHSFLTELPLKSQQDKQNFFAVLIDRLRYFDENIVAVQIGHLLLSRMVFVDETAQKCVLPHILKPKSEEFMGNNIPLFSDNVFRNYIVPQIKKIFGVRDTQIRLILLDFFHEYCNSFNIEELKDVILPNILLGIKDTNDILVSKTLHCLADLVPILGSSIVIGANRMKLFTDGRPNTILSDAHNFNKNEPRSISPVLNSEHSNLVVSGSPLPQHNYLLDEKNNDDEDDDSLNENSHFMPERLSPDGGECDDIDKNILVNTIEPDDDAEWSDWDNNDDLKSIYIESSLNLSSVEESCSQTEVINNKISQITESRHKILDITEFDIKVKNTSKSESEEFDFFKDMEPVITSSEKLSLISENTSINNLPEIEPSLKDIDNISNSHIELELKEDENQTVEACWDDDTTDWGGN